MKNLSKCKRILANLLDYSAFSGLLFLTFSLLDKIDSLFLTFIMTFPFFLVGRLLFISLFKTTLGHALFGLVVSDEKGKRLTFLTAWKSLFHTDETIVWSQKALKWPVRFLSCVSLFLCFMTFPFAGDYKISKVAMLEQIIGGWVECKSEDGGFTIQFPTRPVLEEKDLPISSDENADALRYSEYLSQPKKDHSYSISYITLPKKWTSFGARILLNESLSIIIKNSSGLQLLDKEFKEYAGYRVLDFTAKLGEEKVTGRLLIVGEKLYKLAVSHPTDSDSDHQIEEFMGSLDLK